MIGLELLPKGNAVLSPLNIAHAFSILVCGAAGETKERLLEVLKPFSVNDVREDLNLKCLNLPIRCEIRRIGFTKSLIGLNFLTFIFSILKK